MFFADYYKKESLLMKKMSTCRYLLLCFVFTYALCFSTKAYAYLDPGTGSYMLQVLIAAIVGGLFAIKPFFAKIKSFFIKSTPKEEEDE
jgi:hypothetical protein